MQSNKTMYAVKMATVFGTYTMGTFTNKFEATRYQRSLEASGRRGVRIAEVDGVYNGSIKIA